LQTLKSKVGDSQVVKNGKCSVCYTPVIVSSTQPPQLGLPAMVVVSGRLGSPEGSSVAALWKADANNGSPRCAPFLKGAQVWDFSSLRFSLFLHHKAFLGRWLCS
jgi:hypothetical protein